MTDRDTVPTADDFGGSVEGAPGTAPGAAKAPASEAGADAAPQPQPAPDAGERTSVDIGNPKNVEYWSERFKVTKAQLEEAVSAVGSDVHAVATYLRGQGSGD